jgi:hypothetical protein
MNDKRELTLHGLLSLLFNDGMGETCDGFGCAQRLVAQRNGVAESLRNETSQQ